MTHEAADYIEELEKLLMEQHEQILEEMEDGEKMCELGQRIRERLVHLPDKQTEGV